MKQVDLVKWSKVSEYDYMNYDNSHLGILLKEIELYDHWILAEVLTDTGQKDIVMLQKEINPL